jgi:maltose O-acetyltransferase
MSVVRAIVRQLGIELWIVTVGFLVNTVLAAWPVPRVLRLAGYRLLGARVHTGNIFPGLTVGGPLRNLEIGHGTFLNTGCYLECVGPIRIGTDCQFGPGVMIVTSHHPQEPDGHISRVPQPRPVVIGDRVWVGARVTVLPGTRIGDDVVIAAGAVVARDCTEPGVYAGVPARSMSTHKETT